MKLTTSFLKKLNSYFLLVLILYSYSAFSQIIITEIADPNNNSGADPRRYVEIYNSSSSSISLTDYFLIRWTNGNPDPTNTNAIKLTTACGSSLAAKTFCILSNDTTSNFKTDYGFVSDYNGGSGGPVDSNGDDNLAIVTQSASSFDYNNSYTLIDVFGNADTDGSGQWHEFEDGRAERKSSVTSPVTSWDQSGNWNIDNDSGGGDGAQTAPGGYDPGYWIGATTIDTWNGLSDATWHTGSNWASGSSPASGDNVFIRDSSTDPIISTTSIQVTNLTVESSGTLTINTGKDLTLSGNFSNSGIVTMNSDSDEYAILIVSGTSSGDIKYNLYINDYDDGWDLKGSPVGDGSSNGSVTGTDFESTTISSTVYYALQAYDNSDNSWTANSTSGSQTLTPAKGYSTATDNSSSGETVLFTGPLDTDNVTITITENVGSGDGTQWNLVANPYPSYLALNALATTASDATTNFLTYNATTQDILGYSAGEDVVYAWDGSEYDTYSNASAKYITPGQAFFVSAASGGGTLDFLESMQTTTTSLDDFIENNPMDPDDRAELFIGLSQGDINRDTEIYFLDNTTDGLDSTYDGAVFGLADTSTYIYSRVIQGDEGVDLSIQALAYSEMWDKVIPIGINAIAGEEMTVSVTHKTTPSDLKIYLEDAQEGTFTLINNEDFIMTPTSDLEGVGRFFIHTSENALSNEEVNTSILNAYKKVDSNYITIEGLATQATSTEVSLYNILGTKVMDTTLDNTVNTQTISTNGFSTGIYIIKLESGKNQLTKKLIIK